MMTVKVAKDVIFQELEGEAVLLNMRTGIYFGLNGVGTRIWHLLSEHGEVKTVTTMLLDEYNVSEDQLQNHLSDFIEQLKLKGLVEIREG
jgi:hemerythrin-like domain-containing protein